MSKREATELEKLQRGLNEYTTEVMELWRNKPPALKIKKSFGYFRYDENGYNDEEGELRFRIMLWFQWPAEGGIGVSYDPTQKEIVDLHDWLGKVIEENDPGIIKTELSAEEMDDDLIIIDASSGSTTITLPESTNQVSPRRGSGKTE